MANQEHLDILKQGMEHWNQWRQHLNIERPDLCGADLNSADLRYVDFNGADLSEADLKGANLDRAKLFGAKLIRTDLGFADFTHTTLFNANPSEALLIGVRIFDFYFEAAYLGEADLSDAIFTGGSFARANLQGADLTNAILQHIILILSEHSVQSAWVEREMVAAREKEDREQQPVLFPIRLDDAVMQTTKVWAADVRRRWHIGDFIQWKHHDAYQKVFERLLCDLKTSV